MGAPSTVPNSNRIVSINPATGVPIGDVPDMGVDEVRAAVARARAAQQAWAEVPIEVRCKRVAKFAEVLMDRADDVIDLLVKEMGKTRNEGLGMEVIVVADLVRYFAKRAPSMLARERISMHLLKNRASYLHYVPRGVVGIISPWNFPLSIPMGETVMALMAGNAVVLKPSEVTPLVALKCQDLMAAAGVPIDLFQVVTGRGPTGAALIDAGINFCVFTGSVATGKKVGAACAERMIPFTLELGGKAPAIVCKDADLERTAMALTWGAFANAGQVCASVERVYVVDEVHDALVERVVNLTQTLRQGDPGAVEVDMGAMAWERQRDHVAQLVTRAIADGAVARTGGQAPTGVGHFYPPTVLTGCTQTMDVMRKEIFGPVMPIMRVRDEDEAVRLANDSHLGLTAYVFSKDTARARLLADRIEAGTVQVNDVLNTFAMPETPWGGVKQSGLGRTHGAHGLRDLCDTRHVNYDLFGGKKEVWWYPYEPKTYSFAMKAARLLFGRRPWA